VRKVRNLLFDLDGTLVDSSQTIGICIDHALEQLGVKPSSGSPVNELIGQPLLDIFRNHFDLTLEQADSAIAYYREHYDTQAQAGSLVYGGIEETLLKLRQGGFRLFIATVKPTSVADKVLCDLGLRAHFDAVAGASMGHERRDKASIIAHALSQFGLDPEHSLMIGDRDQDVLGARQNGLPCIAVSWGFGSPGELAHARPDYLVRHSTDIVSLLMNPIVAK
jgi:phosphoglycolate phosphatase